jgi:benzoyl-CoA reductase/2-hydroxyglutaryl-CoA dehydratase subunit BcrC/BadD/HgdB
MMRSHFESIVAGIDARLAAAGPDEPVARKTFARFAARLGARVFTPDEPLAWCGVMVPFELLHAAGLTPCYAEFVGASLAGMDEIGRVIDTAEQAGYSTDACTYHRVVNGAMVSGLMPSPELLVASTCPCTGGQAVIEGMAKHFGKPLVVLEIPQRADDAAVGFLAGQLRGLSERIAEHTGRRLDPERLRQAVRASNQARELLQETYALAAAVPTPARRRDLINLALVLALGLGTTEAVEVARTYRDELARKQRLGEAGVPGEQVRLLWFQNRVQFKSGIEELLEIELHAAVVADELNDITWDPIDEDRPFTGLARRLLASPLVGPIERRIAHLVDQCRRFSIDGAILPCHWGCRQGTGARGLITEGLRRVGIPVLGLEVDCVDPRAYAQGQVRTRLEAFLEMITERKAAAAAQ